jgi:hypothetical protein
VWLPFSCLESCRVQNPPHWPWLYGKEAEETMRGTGRNHIVIASFPFRSSSRFVSLRSVGLLYGKMNDDLPRQARDAKKTQHEGGWYFTQVP